MLGNRKSSVASDPTDYDGGDDQRDRRQNEERMPRSGRRHRRSVAEGLARALSRAAASRTAAAAASRRLFPANPRNARPRPKEIGRSGSSRGARRDLTRGTSGHPSPSGAAQPPHTGARPIPWTGAYRPAGLRASELIGLRLNDLDFEQRLINVAGVNSKSGRTRDVTMVREVAAALDAYLADERPKADAEDEPLFVTERGRAFTRSGVTQLFDRLKARTGIRGLCAHICRHTWATNFRRAGSGDVFDLQGEGGWSDLRMVRRYSKMRPLEERRRAPSPFAAARRTQTTGMRSLGQRNGLAVVPRAAGQ